MSGEVRDVTHLYRAAEKAAETAMGNYSWKQQYCLPDLEASVRAAWIHGYVAGLEARRPALTVPDSAGGSRE